VHTDWKHRAFRIAILERDGWRCNWCGERANEVDYVVALVDGGQAHDSANAVAACRGQAAGNPQDGEAGRRREG
jgi:hypothetical protein